MIICILKQILKLLFHIFWPARKQSDLVIENFALRQQLSIYHRTIKRPKIRGRDRLFWIVLSDVWKEWRNVLIVVKPDTRNAVGIKEVSGFFGDWGRSRF